jgi:hypothetical protein
MCIPTHIPKIIHKHNHIVNDNADCMTAFTMAATVSIELYSICNLHKMVLKKTYSIAPHCRTSMEHTKQTDILHYESTLKWLVVCEC